MMNRCEGACVSQEECTGAIQRVSVDWNNDPIEFWYCQTAIEEDRRRGFVVTVVDKEDLE